MLTARRMIVAGGATPRSPHFGLIGVLLGAAYWLLESMLHSYVFGTDSLLDTLVCDHDPNELWMRVVIVVLFAGFGHVAQRAVAAERVMKEEAQRIHGLRELADSVSDHVYAGSRPATLSAEDDIASLSRTLSDLPGFLDSRFRELQALLQLTHEINKGSLLEEVLDKAWDVLHRVIPYDRLGVALLEDGGRTARSCWARSNGSRIILARNYSASLEGSSLQQILDSGEPRILNDLEEYLALRPTSISTRMMVMEGIRSSLTCPLISMQKPVGFIFFSSREKGVYSGAHVELFQLIAGHLSLVVEKGQMYQKILQEKQKSDALLLNVMPERVAERLRAGEETVAEALPQVTILFVDIVEFTSFAARYNPERVVALLRDIFVLIDELCDRYGVEKIKTIGDGYLAITGSHAADPQIAARDMAEFALHVRRALGRIAYPDGTPVRIRMGVSSGPAVAGVIGQKKFFYDIWGDAVNVASRMQSTGRAGEIHVTQAVHDLLKDDFEFEPRGDISVKGKGPMATWFLTGKRVSSAAERGLPERRG